MRGGHGDRVGGIAASGGVNDWRGGGARTLRQYCLSQEIRARHTTPLLGKAPAVRELESHQERNRMEGMGSSNLGCNIHS